MKNLDFYLTSWFHLFWSKTASEIDIIPFSYERKDKSINHTAMLNIRLSYMKGYSYLTIKITPFIMFNIDFHL